MKRNFLKFMIVVIWLLINCISFHSCQKDEIYNPEQKIKKIYLENLRYGAFPKVLWQEWTWDSNKLMRIDYYSPNNNNISNTEYYTYEENKLVKVTDNYGYFQIFYNDSKYDKIEYLKKDDNFLIATWDFSYRNNKVSKIIFTYDYSDWWINKIDQSGFLFSLIPKEFITTIENSAKGHKNSSYPMVTTFTYKYNGDNIKEVKWESDEYSSITTIYKFYDNKLNPFHKHVGLMDIAPLLHLIDVVTSKNNPVEVQKLRSQGPVAEVMSKYSYKYNKSFPFEVEVTEITKYRIGYSDITYYSDTTDNYKTYYEWE